ncbi:hypothetical protein M9H77_34216 [Catharanthus roseus]|uniref:Uncharacterized protein n=1 Tax=Catharanthus roseus TaxID=4058 RepID=A0ACB9ZLR3_CATRO|nr:hypothetical protein M9H77_34216 [Catharanthus roseus]
MIQVHPGLLSNHCLYLLDLDLTSYHTCLTLLYHMRHYGSTHPHSQPPPAVYDPYLAAPTIRPHIPYRSSAQEPLTEWLAPSSTTLRIAYMVNTAGDYGISSSEPFMGEAMRSLTRSDPCILGDRRMRELMMVVGDNNDNDGGGDGDGEDAGDEEQSVPLAPVAPASGSDGWPHHGKEKGLTSSFMSARDVPAPTQGKRVKASNWEQTGPTE